MHTQRTIKYGGRRSRPSIALGSQVVNGNCADLYGSEQYHHANNKYSHSCMAGLNSHVFCFRQLCKADILVCKVMHHPHGKHECYIADTVIGNSFECIFYRQITVTVKSY